MQNSKINNFFCSLLLLILAAIFLFSGISKLLDPHYFEITLIKSGMAIGSKAAFLARFLIGVELMLGAFLLFHLKLQRFTYPVALFFIMAMCFYLVLQLLHHNTQADCGCFGAILPMSIKEALLKNIWMLITLIALWKSHKIKDYKRHEYLVGFLGIIAFLLPFMLYAKPQKLKLDSLYTIPAAAPKIELRKGKHIVAFLSLTCSHCVDAAKQFSTIYKADSTLPIYLVLSGYPNQLEGFIKETNIANIPKTYFPDHKNFVKMAGPFVPSINWINDGWVERNTDVTELSASQMAAWAK